MPTFEKVIERKAAEVARNLEGVSGDGVSFDPTTIIAIITTVLQLFKSCSLTPKQAENRAYDPRLLDKLRLRRIIRQHSSGDNEALEAALMDSGADLTEAEVKTLYTEID